MLKRSVQEKGWVDLPLGKQLDDEYLTWHFALGDLLHHRVENVGVCLQIHLLAQNFRKILYITAKTMEGLQENDGKKYIENSFIQDTFF